MLSLTKRKAGHNLTTIYEDVNEDVNEDDRTTYTTKTLKHSNKKRRSRMRSINEVIDEWMPGWYDLLLRLYQRDRTVPDPALDEEYQGLIGRLSRLDLSNENHRHMLILFTGVLDEDDHNRFMLEIQQRERATATHSGTHSGSDHSSPSNASTTGSTGGQSNSSFDSAIGHRSDSTPGASSFSAATYGSEVPSHSGNSTSPSRASVGSGSGSSSGNNVASSNVASSNVASSDVASSSVVDSSVVGSNVPTPAPPTPAPPAATSPAATPAPPAATSPAATPAPPAATSPNSFSSVGAERLHSFMQVGLGISQSFNPAVTQFRRSNPSSGIDETTEQIPPLDPRLDPLSGGRPTATSDPLHGEGIDSSSHGSDGNDSSSGRHPIPSHINANSTSPSRASVMTGSGSGSSSGMTERDPPLDPLSGGRPTTTSDPTVVTPAEEREDREPEATENTQGTANSSPTDEERATCSSCFGFLVSLFVGKSTGTPE